MHQLFDVSSKVTDVIPLQEPLSAVKTSSSMVVSDGS